MSQSSITIPNTNSATFRANVNNALAAIASDFSGPSAPTTTWALMKWADTLNSQLKLRNLSNTDWMAILDLTTGKIVNSQTVTIMQGQVVSGGTIPLPDGYTQEQCHWMIGLGAINASDDNSLQHMAKIYCYESNRVVTCYARITSGYEADNRFGTANYIIIGVK